MSLPYFYAPELRTGSLTLEEDNSRHIISVLRMKKGDALLLTDGKGQKAQAIIEQEHKKNCVVAIHSIQRSEPGNAPATIAISLVKNVSRFEWFLEKATEIGIRGIIPMICARTEREKFRQDRMEGILISAMLQSQQSWKPILHQPTAFETVIKENSQDIRLIAHCEETDRQSMRSILQNDSRNRIILIGPEGDFTHEEIEQARQQGFIPVTLGHTRLRTETAGMVAATLFNI